MPTTSEIDRLAAAIHELRPDWPVRSLVTYIARTHSNRGYRDLGIALAAVALDPVSLTPKRVEESGPWWSAAQTAFGAATATPGPGRETRCEVYGHEAHAARTCTACRSVWLTERTWPAGTKHQEATHAEHDTDARTRAAGERDE